MKLDVDGVMNGKFTHFWKAFLMNEGTAVFLMTILIYNDFPGKQMVFMRIIFNFKQIKER